MSIVPVSYLSSSDLANLGNNLLPVARREHRELHAVNRALEAHQEQVKRLFRPRRWVRAAPATRKQMPAA